MRLSAILYFLFFSIVTVLIIITDSGCAQIGAPTGGAKDTIPPRLVTATPVSGTTNFSGNKITLTFDEYIDVKEVQTNVLISPLTKTNPSINFKLKTVTIKIKDTLQPNTTYSINFGNAIQDVNENNPLRDFTYVFSTGKTIDSMTLSGKVILAENGATDSTIAVMLYRNANDSSVQKRRPDYIARLKGDGSFLFKNLPKDNFNIYALKDGDGGKTYNAKTELFAFADKPITISDVNEPVTLYAYAEEKEKPRASSTTKTSDKKLRYTPSAAQQDLLTDFTITFTKPLKKFDASKILLTDTNYVAVPNTAVLLDSTHTKVSLSVKWKEGEPYRILLDKDAVSDSADNSIFKSDTIRLIAKKETDYGNLVIRFSNLDLSQHPVLQFVQGDEVKEAYPLQGNEWSKKLFLPGEYIIRILFDDNGNGKWDPGSYTKKRQPERVITLPQKISIRANWDNEREIKL